MKQLNDDIQKYIEDHSDAKVLIYGAGVNGRRCLKYIKNADYYVDKNAAEIKEVEGIPCITPEESFELPGDKLVIISIAAPKVRSEVRKLYEGVEKCIVTEFVTALDTGEYQYKCKPAGPLKINIVYADDGWIFGKFAHNLRQELRELGQICEITPSEDPLADINHYIAYASLPEIYSFTNTKRTTMITHIDNALKLDLLKMQSENGVIGICMSKDTLLKLQRWGIRPDTLCYINPAHDGEIKPRKIHIGITNKCHHEDFRKRDDIILQVMKRVDSSLFKISIMGGGWDSIVNELEKVGIEVSYYPDFDRKTYMEIMPSFDYWFYYGFDEGAMGYLDALAAGVRTIVTPQGYHLDAIPGPTYTCNTIDDFVKVFDAIASEKKAIIDSVADWTWENYAKKHLEIWKYMAGTISMKELYTHQNEYMDGIFSLLPVNNTVG